MSITHAGITVEALEHGHDTLVKLRMKNGPDDPNTIRRLLDRCHEAMQLTRDTETVKRLQEYADQLRQRLRKLTRRQGAPNDTHL